MIGIRRPFLEDLARVHGGAARRDAAHVDLVDQRRRVPLKRVVVEDRLDDIDVGQMHPAGDIGVVEDEDVAGMNVVGVLPRQLDHRVRK